MTREAAALEPALIAWLVDDHHEPESGWAPDPPLETLHCHPDLVARLSEIARPIAGTARVFVSGCPVIHHPDGQPIAAASGTAWLAIRSGRAEGDLAGTWHTPALGTLWAELDPWAGTVAFARGIDLLRGHLADAFTLAGALAGS